MSKQIRFNALDFEPVKAIALKFPGTKEGFSHEGTPSVKMKDKLMCRLHESGQFIPVRMDIPIRDRYLARYPGIFLLPPNFKGYPYLAMKVHKYDPDFLWKLLEESWLCMATKKEITQWEAMKSAR